jgi:hypothetical protein
MPDPRRKAQKKTPLSKAQRDEPQLDSAAAAPTPQHDFLAQAAAKPGGDVQAHATTLTRATGNRLARAGQAILQLQRQYGNRYVQRVVDFARKITPPLQAQARPENKTGLPDDLKTNVESLSGIALDDVKVHYNSDKPAQVQALAYTQGADIHVAPGQEAHLPHETWHVVQQKQGRVQPTLQAKDLSLNDDPSLENEATAMGAKAMQPSQPLGTSTLSAGEPTQLKSNNPVQRLLKYPYDIEGTRLEGPPQKIEFDANTPYQTLVNYKTMWNEQQINHLANRQWEFQQNDVATLNQLIANKEADVNGVAEVICPEGEVKVALPGQSMTFGDVSSCMTISIILTDSTVISAHNGQMALLPNSGITRLNQIRNNRQIASVLAIGAGFMWDQNMRAQWLNGNPNPNFDWDNTISSDTGTFETFLSGQFGNAPATFQDHDAGRAGINAAGQYVQG